MRTVGGIVLIVLGVVAIPIPIVPGIPMVVAGAAILDGKYAIVRYVRAWLQNLGMFRSPTLLR